MRGLQSRITKNARLPSFGRRTAQQTSRPFAALLQSPALAAQLGLSADSRLGISRCSNSKNSASSIRSRCRRVSQLSGCSHCSSGGISKVTQPRRTSRATRPIRSIGFEPALPKESEVELIGTRRTDSSVIHSSIVLPSMILKPRSCPIRNSDRLDYTASRSPRTS